MGIFSSLLHPSKSSLSPKKIAKAEAAAARKKDELAKKEEQRIKFERADAVLRAAEQASARERYHAQLTRWEPPASVSDSIETMSIASSTPSQSSKMRNQRSVYDNIYRSQRSIDAQIFATPMGGGNMQSMGANLL